MYVPNHAILSKVIRPIGWMGLYLLVAGYCQYFFAYDYFYAEQFEFFRFSTDYAVESVLQWAGLSSYLAAFLMQFFVVPYVGAAVAALLFMAVAWEMRCVWKKMTGTTGSPLLYLLPSLALLWIETDFNYCWGGSVALWLALLLLHLCLLVPSFGKRLGCMALLFVPGYYAIGPWMLIAATGILFNGLSEHRWLSLLLVLWCLFWAVLYYIAGVVPEMRFLFTPSSYYHPKLALPMVGWYAGAACLLNLLAAWGWGKRVQAWPDWLTAVSFTCQMAFATFLCHWGTSRYHSSQNYIAKALDYHCRAGQWQKILDLPGLRAGSNLMHACYQNLALAELGRLGDDLLDYGQCGSRGIVLPWNRTTGSSMLLSDVFYRMGNVALAQEMAFEGMIVSPKGITPRLLIRLVQTNLIYGYHAVAEKYIRLLEQTWAYAATASRYRQFLYYPERLDADEELGGRKRCMEMASGLTNDHQVLDNLLQIMRSNPSWRPAFLYYGAICLLNKDVNAFRDFIENHKEAPGLHPLPGIFQEAVILVHEHESGHWASYGVTPETIARFKAYRQAVSAARKGQNSVGRLQREFGNTYWYYYMFKR